jgi:acyl-homoserine lactone acylase PvdQ
LIITLSKEPENEKFNKICRGSYPEYKGRTHCIYNVARAMAEANAFLTKEISPEIKDWEWKNVHVNEYGNMPWSLTGLKFLFHKETPIGGNGNTIKVSKYSDSKVKANKAFKATHTPNYKQVISFSEDSHETIMYYSHDGGQSGNLFAGHYFDFNHIHS